MAGCVINYMIFGGNIVERRVDVLGNERLTEWIDDGEEKYAVPRMVLRKNGHQNCCNKLAKYEDLEEQGLLLRTMARVGDKVYHVITDRCHNPVTYISEHEINDVSAKAVYFADQWWTQEEMKDCDAFLDKSEAEEKLRESEEFHEIQRV